MKISVAKSDDIEELRTFHKLAFADDAWPGDNHEFWVARDEYGYVVGFCSAIQYQDGTVFLSRSAVIRGASGRGVQRRMIRTRVAWAKRVKATAVVTYVLNKNYTSMVNLLRSGFKFAYHLHGTEHWMYYGDIKPSDKSFQQML